MLRWLSLALVLATNVAAFTDTPSPKPKEPSDAPSQCQARAWVRAPDMVPGEVIAGDVKIKLSGQCTDTESFTLGLRYKEKVFWKLRREDVPIPKRPKLTYNQTVPKFDLFQVRFQEFVPDYNEAEWRAYENSVQNKDLWSVHEEERIAFEIKSLLADAGRTDPLSRNFTTRFGVLVPNTNYPPGLECRVGSMPNRGETDMASSESIYEYFVEIGFSNGTTSEIPAGITSFTPFYLSTENKAPSINVSLSQAPAHSGFNTKLSKPSADRLWSNYTIEVSFPEGAHVYQNSSVNITAVVHRIGYTNRTDIPVELCASSANGIEWHSQELQNRSLPFTPFIKALVPSMQHPRLSQIAHPVPHFPCSAIKFAATPAHLPHKSHIFSASSEPLSLSLYVGHDAVPDFSMYYQKLGHRVKLNLHIKPDPSEALDNEFEKIQQETVDADEFDWVPWMPRQTPIQMMPKKQTHPRSLFGDTNLLSVVLAQKQGAVRSMPVHYLSDKARQPVFVDSSDIADLRLMLPEERDLIAPVTQPSIKMFAKGEELPRRYFPSDNLRDPIYVGDTWVKKVLPMIAEGQHERDIVDHLFVVQR